MFTKYIPEMSFPVDSLFLFINLPKIKLKCSKNKKPNNRLLFFKADLLFSFMFFKNKLSKENKESFDSNIVKSWTLS